MKIRESNINDINQITSLMLQVAEIHFDARKDIFKEKSIKQIKSELKERFENNENKHKVEPYIKVPKTDKARVWHLYLQSAEHPVRFTELHLCRLVRHWTGRWNFANKIWLQS